MKIVRRESELQSRSISGQIAHWMRIGRAIDELSLKAKRPHLSGETRAEPSEHKKAFDGYVRKGET